MFQDKWIKVTKDEYVLDASDDQDGSVCMLLLVGVNQAYNVFGTPIFQGYYTVHQQLGNGRARLGFVPNNVSRKSKLSDGTTIRQLLKFGNQSSYTVSDG